MNILPVTLAYKIPEQPVEKRWLIETLWAQQAVGIIGGEPKCCKSFLALSLAVAVASGKPCLGQFRVPEPGRVLLFPAEDALPVVKRRLQGIAAAQGVNLEGLPIVVIATPVLRLDSKTDCDRLRDTIEKVKPSILILDPFVRLHSIDENLSHEVAKILHILRQMQRSLKVAVALVHHAKKNASKTRPGQALRGSSEFHAWGDSNLYIQKRLDNHFSLTIEHRAEPSPDPLDLTLVASDAPYLKILKSGNVPTQPNSTHSPQQIILSTIASANRPLRPTEIRDSVKLRHATVTNTLQSLTKNGSLIATQQGFTLPIKSQV